MERCVRYNVKSIEGWLAENTSGSKKAADSQSTSDAEVRHEHATRRE
jgi:hypothetical protein